MRRVPPVAMLLAVALVLHLFMLASGPGEAGVGGHGDAGHQAAATWDGPGEDPGAGQADHLMLAMCLAVMTVGAVAVLAHVRYEDENAPPAAVTVLHAAWERHRGSGHDPRWASPVDAGVLLRV